MAEYVRGSFGLQPPPVTQHRNLLEIQARDRPASGSTSVCDPTAKANATVQSKLGRITKLATRPRSPVKRDSSPQVSDAHMAALTRRFAGRSGLFLRIFPRALPIIAAICTALSDRSTAACARPAFRQPLATAYQVARGSASARVWKKMKISLNPQRWRSGSVPSQVRATCDNYTIVSRKRVGSYARDR